MGQELHRTTIPTRWLFKTTICSNKNLGQSRTKSSLFSSLFNSSNIRKIVLISTSYSRITICQTRWSSNSTISSNSRTSRLLGTAKMKIKVIQWNNNKISSRICSNNNNNINSKYHKKRREERTNNSQPSMGCHLSNTL